MGIVYYSSEKSSVVNDIKAWNMRNIMCILLSKGEQTKMDLVCSTGLSVSTVSDCTNKLVNAGLVDLCGSERSSGGRRPSLFRIHGDYGTALGIVLLPNSIEITAITLQGAVLLRRVVQREDKRLLTALFEVVEEAIEQLRPSRPVALGVGIQGASNVDQGVVIENGAYDWHNVHLKELLERRFGIYTCVDHVINAAVSYQRTFGIAQNAGSFACLFSRFPEKAGIVIDGKLLRGRSNLSGSLKSPQQMTDLFALLDLEVLITDMNDIHAPYVSAPGGVWEDFALGAAVMAEIAWFETIYDLM